MRRTGPVRGREVGRGRALLVDDGLGQMWWYMREKK